MWYSFCMNEFELTYLPKNIPAAVWSSPSKEMVDIYIPASAPHPHLRIRKSGSKYEITNKQPAVDGDSSHQIEQTIPLTAEEYADLEKVPGKRVYKKRYLYNENGIDYEIDVFGGDLTGLVLVDVEFSSAEEKATFKAPAWVLIDVTQESFIAGGMLCGKAYRDIQDKLTQFGYSPSKV
jgi:adenylate cyclase